MITPAMEFIETYDDSFLRFLQDVPPQSQNTKVIGDMPLSNYLEELH